MSDSDDFALFSEPESNQEAPGDSESDEMVFSGLVEPYQGEPLAHSSDEDDEDHGEDRDGLSPAIVRSRFEGESPLEEWCKCGLCSTENLTSALEYRCCFEVLEARHKLIFDGSIERISCITQHDDYQAMTNTTVLTQAGPLVRDRNGRNYRRRTGKSHNDFFRAVAYRWLVRWIFGFLGWENTLPLTACIYEHIRKKYPSHQRTGYQSAQQRA